MQSQNAACSWVQAANHISAQSDQSLISLFFNQMSNSQERTAEILDAASPASSLSSSSAASVSDSSAISEAHEDVPAVIGIEEQEDEEEDDDCREDLVTLRMIPGSPRSSTSPVEALEERTSSEDCPLSARVYSNPSCKISAALQRQCCTLWSQFDNIGTEMIVTRRGR